MILEKNIIHFMLPDTIHFSSSATDFYFKATLDHLKTIAPTENSFIITDENLMLAYADRFKPWRTITIPAGESSKSLEILDDIVRQLLAMDADRNATIIGIGGGVVTDITGFAAGIYKRGVRCGFVPTSILGMVDASIGGKNGLDVGIYKNMIGLVRQPAFLLYDLSLLKTLPKEEWINGFAEIIKHACIYDAGMFGLLEQHTLSNFMENEALLEALVQRNALLKTRVVQEDEFESGERKKLNFGHTLAHAIENKYDLPHGHAVSLGMAFAALLSEKYTGFKQADRLIRLLEKYHLPVELDYDKADALKYMATDKKRKGGSIDYILLRDIGEAEIRPILIDELSQLMLSEPQV